RLSPPRALAQLVDALAQLGVGVVFELGLEGADQSHPLLVFLELLRLAGVQRAIQQGGHRARIAVAPGREPRLDRARRRGSDRDAGPARTGTQARPGQGRRPGPDRDAGPARTGTPAGPGHGPARPLQRRRAMPKADATPTGAAARPLSAGVRTPGGFPSRSCG